MTKGKKHIALGLYESGRLEVFFNPRAEGIVVPEHLRDHPQVKFDYGEDLPIPIPDLVIDDAGIAATLSFNRTPFKTFLPWGSVYFMLSTTDGMQGHAVWPDDVPSHLKKTADAESPSETQAAAASVGAPAAGPAKRDRPAWLKLVE